MREARRTQRSRGGDSVRHVGSGRESQRAPRPESLSRPDRAGEDDMKTDDLIAVLGANVERVDLRQVTRTVGVAVAIGVAMALGTTLFVSGTRADLNEVGSWSFLVLK